MALTPDDMRALSDLIDQKLAPIIKQGQDTFNELMNVEKELLATQDSVKDLHIKHDTLLLKSDNTALLLKLIDKQSEEMTALKDRVSRLESKLA